MDPISLRAFLRVPTEEELETVGFADKAIRDAITSSISVNLDGLRRLVEFRQSENRGPVAAFDKQDEWGARPATA